MSNLNVNTDPATSTTFGLMVQRYLVEYTVPVMAVGAVAASTVTVTGLTTNSIMAFVPRQRTNSSVVGVYVLEPRCSTANELCVQFANLSGSTISGSTMSGYLLQFSF